MSENRVDSLVGDVRRGLQAHKRAIAVEMRGYPQPIAGCDAQYQHLSDRRAAIARTLSGLDRACAVGPDAVATFVDSSDELDSESRRRLRRALADDLSGPS